MNFKQYCRCPLAVLLLMVISTSASAQAVGIDLQKYEDQTKDLLKQLQQPDSDPESVMQQMGELAQRFREEGANLPPEQLEQLQQKMMEHLQPVFIQAMPTIFRRMRENAINQIRKELDCTDEEFSVLKPALQKVMDALEAAGGGPPTMGGPSSLAIAARELNLALQDTSTKPEVIHEKMEALRRAREQSQRDLAVARAELRPLLTLRQESALVADGLLD